MEMIEAADGRLFFLFPGMIVGKLVVYLQVIRIIVIYKYQHLMKTFKTTVKSFLCGLLCVVLSAPALTSCYDDSAVWEEIGKISDKLEELEQSLNGQIQAFNDLISGGNITIASYEPKTDGTCIVTLSNGTKFSVLPNGHNTSSLISYMVVNNVKCWAVYGAGGDLHVLKDSEGNPIPVEAVVPVVEERDGKFYLIVGDEEYETGFSADSELSIISGYELNTDETGNAYSVTFAFGEGMTFTIPVDGYMGFSFRLGTAGQTRVIKDYYVDYGSTGQVVAGMDGVVDYVLQIPDGWRVEEETDELMGETYLNITAPSKASVEAGEAVAEGNMKVVAVVEGGKAMAARLSLSVSPFKTFTATSANAVVEIRNGVDKFIYGLAAAPVDADAVFAEAQSLLAANGKGVATSDVVLPLEEVNGAAMVSGVRYVLWAMPAFYDYSDESAGYSLKEGVLTTYEFTYNNIKLETASVTYNDASIKVDLGGATSYYAGTALKAESLFDDILLEINGGLAEVYDSPLAYEGSAFGFPVASALEPQPEESYVTWIVPVVDGKDKYIKDDVVYVEYTLSGIVSGGAVETVAGKAEVTRTSISAPLSASGASSIVYAFESGKYAGRYKTQEQMADFLLSKGEMVYADEYTAVLDRLAPASEWVLFAMAIDNEGKYGAVIKEAYTTEAMKYNDLTVTVSAGETSMKKASVNVAVSGGEAAEYVWWFGKESDPFWTSSDYCNKRESDAGQYMALYPDDPAIVKAMNSSVFADGVVNMSNLTQATTYVFVVIAKDAETGEYSKADSYKFNTLAADLGTVVQEGSDEWNAAKARISLKFIPETYYTDREFAAYAYEYTGPADMTAYIVSGSKDYFKGNSSIRTVADQIIEIKDYASRPIDKDWSKQVNGKPECEIYYDDKGNIKEGNVICFWDFGTHGLANWGSVTYFSPSHHGYSNCGECDERVNDPTATSDRSYAGQVAAIKEKTTLEYYKDRAVVRYGLTNEESINKTAESLLSIYKEYYENSKPCVYINNGSVLRITQREGIGVNDSGEVQDAVIIVLRDADNNYYAPMFFPVENNF